MFAIVDLPESTMQKVAAHSCALKEAWEYYAHARTFPELMAKVDQMPEAQRRELIEFGGTFQVGVATCGCKLTDPERNELREELGSHLPLKGTVQCKQPDRDFRIVHSVLYQDKYDAHQIIDNDRGFWAFGRYVYEGQRHLTSHYHLSRRNYLGTTSMDAELSLFMAALGQVSRESMVGDPFVGTGSIALGASVMGAAAVFGVDIDRASMAGSWKYEDGHETGIRSMYAFYGLQNRSPSILAADMSRPYFRRVGNGLFDAILTDPPYGIREKSRKIGTKRQPKGEDATEDDTATATATAQAPMEEDPAQKTPSLLERFPGHVAQKKAYTGDEAMCDLMRMAARYLRLRGRLVFWLATTYAYQPSDIPMHPCLSHLHDIPLTHNGWQRRLQVFEKVRPLSSENEDALWPGDVYPDRRPAHAALQDALFGTVRGMKKPHKQRTRKERRAEAAAIRNQAVERRAG